MNDKLEPNNVVAEPAAAPPPYPLIFQKHVAAMASIDGAALAPRRETKRFHALEIPGWTGHVNVTDIQGYAENKRLKFYLNRWRNRRGTPDAMPTTQDMYEMMLEADAEEEREDKKIFYVDRLARSIVRNGVQEEIIVFLDQAGRLWLWDGNRRFFSTWHIMHDEAFKQFREDAQWLPCFLIESTGNPALDARRKHAILTETNFVKKDAISWPTYIKAEEIWEQFNIRIKLDPADPVLSREVKDELAREYGLYSKGKPSWRQVDRWVKMVNLAREFKEYQEEDKQRDEDSVDLRLSNYFEYFDELSKPKIKAAIETDAEKRDEVFDWLWEGKFPSFSSVRAIPRIYEDPVALAHMRSSDAKAFENAQSALAANDPNLIKDKRAADAKIEQFAVWLDSFKREDFRQLNADSLDRLKAILSDTTKMLQALVQGATQEQEESERVNNAALPS